jgi:hypothetical protein
MYKRTKIAKKWSEIAYDTTQQMQDHPMYGRELTGESKVPSLLMMAIADRQKTKSNQTPTLGFKSEQEMQKWMQETLMEGARAKVEVRRDNSRDDLDKAVSIATSFNPSTSLAKGVFDVVKDTASYKNQSRYKKPTEAKKALNTGGRVLEVTNRAYKRLASKLGPISTANELIKQTLGNKQYSLKQPSSYSKKGFKDYLARENNPALKENTPPPKAREPSSNPGITRPALKTNKTPTTPSSKVIKKAYDMGVKLALNNFYKKANPAPRPPTAALPKTPTALKLNKVKTPSSKALGAASKSLGVASKAIGPISYAQDAYKLTSREGRNQLKKEYSPTPTRPTSAVEAVTAPFVDMATAVTSPLSPAGITAATRTMGRVAKGGQVNMRQRVNAAKRGDTQATRHIVNTMPFNHI